MKVDPQGNECAGPDYVNWLLSRGRLFNAVAHVTDAPAATPWLMALTTGSHRLRVQCMRVHTICDIDAIRVWEGVTDVTGGTGVPLVNRNRNCTDTLETRVTQDVTSYAGGTSFERSRVFVPVTGSPSSHEPQCADEGVEFVLRPHTAYVLEFVAGPDMLTMDVELNCYEELP